MSRYSLCAVTSSSKVWVMEEEFFLPRCWNKPLQPNVEKGRVLESHLHSIFLASVEIWFFVWILIYLSILGDCCWVPLVFK